MLEQDTIAELQAVCAETIGKAISFAEYDSAMRAAGEIVDGRFAVINHAHIDLTQYDSALIVLVTRADDVFDHSGCDNVDTTETGFICARSFDLSQHVEADNLFIDLVRNQLNNSALPDEC